MKLSELRGALSHALDITDERPYRGAVPVPVDKTLAIMAESLGTAIDADCFAHLQKIIRTSPEFFPQ